MVLMAYCVGGLAFVRIKLGIRLWSWGWCPGNIRIDISTRTSIFGLCGGEHTLHGLRQRDQMVGLEKGRGSVDGGGSVVAASDPGNAVCTSSATGNSGG